MTNSSFDAVPDLRKIINRSKITPTHLFGEHGEDSARMADAAAGSPKASGIQSRSQSSGLINKKASLQQKRRLEGGGASGQIMRYGIGGKVRSPFVSH